jgi:hypothetical protein
MYDLDWDNQPYSYITAAERQGLAFLLGPRSKKPRKIKTHEKKGRSLKLDSSSWASQLTSE